jgi:hypothetical protein
LPVRGTEAEALFRYMYCRRADVAENGLNEGGGRSATAVWPGIRLAMVKGERLGGVPA